MKKLLRYVSVALRHPRPWRFAMRPGSVAFLALLAFSSSASGAVIRIKVAGGERPEEVRVRLVGKARDGRGEPKVSELLVSRGSEKDVTVPAEMADRIVSVEADGFWVSEPVRLAGTVEGNRIELWPAGVLAGRPTTTSGRAGEVLLRFKSSARGNDEGNGAAGSVTCPVEAGAFRCEIPAGVLDVSIRVRGHASRYFFKEPIVEGAVRDLGELTFRPGASVVGNVASGEKGLQLGKVKVALRPSASGARTAAGDERSFAGATVEAGERGFFTFEVVPAGRYEIVATGPGLADARRELTVIEGAEANLSAPLLMTRPRALEARMSPSFDPAGKPWRVRLIKQEGVGRFETVAESQADTAGIWRQTGLPSSEAYSLVVLTSSGDVWWQDDGVFHLEDSPQVRAVVVKVEDVDGIVRLGKTPLVAELTFRRKGSSLSVKTSSEKNGSFSTVLPELGEWDVRVSSSAPVARRTMEVRLSRGAGEARSRVLLELPDFALQGELVDEEGRPVDRAIVNVKRMGSREFLQQHVEGGTFRFDGLEAGTYDVSADGGEKRSESVATRVSDTEETPSLRLVLKALNQVRARIVAPGGAGVPGSSVQTLPSAEAPSDIGARGVSDGSGRLTLKVRPGARAVCAIVSPPGFGVRMVHLPVSQDETTVPVTQSVGTLSLDYPIATSSRFAVLFSGDCFAYPPMVQKYLSEAERTVDQVRWRLTLPGLQAGSYRLCQTNWGELASGNIPVCKTAELVPGGRAEIRIEK